MVTLASSNIFLGPIPDLIRISGDTKAPALKITSRFAKAICGIPLCLRNVTPYANGVEGLESFIKTWKDYKF